MVRSARVRLQVVTYEGMIEDVKTVVNSPHRTLAPAPFGDEVANVGPLRGV